MRKKLLSLALIVFIISFALAMGGCAKKAPVTTEPVGVTAPDTAKAEADAKAAAAEAARKEREALLEKELKEKAEREKLLAEAATFGDIYFDFDKYDLKPEARNVLSRLGDWLVEHGNFEIAIEGHCDERGTKEYNLALGERRAEAGKTYLVNLGVDAMRITTISYGEELPLDPGHNEEAWSKNRRDHFVIYPVSK